jgi:hypothetical protein
LGPVVATALGPKSKSFLLLFFKKEDLALPFAKSPML